MEIRASVTIPFLEANQVRSPILHVPRWLADVSRELAETGEYLIYCTDYPLTEDQAIELAAARICLDEDRLFLKAMLELNNETD